MYMIDGQVHLTSRYHAMLQPDPFSKFGTLPVLGDISKGSSLCPTTFGKMPNIVGTLPKVPHLTLPETHA